MKQDAFGNDDPQQDPVPSFAVAHAAPRLSQAHLANREGMFKNIADAARFPGENPNPVFRVAPGGRVLYANRASRPLLALWHVETDGCLPAEWQERIARVFASGEARKWETPCDDLILQLHCVPIPDAGYVNVYASDVTERERLLTELQQKHRELEMQAAQIQALNVDLDRRVHERTAELEAIFASVPDALYVTNGHRIVRANRAALEGLGVDSLEELQESVVSLAERMQARYADTGQPIPLRELTISRALRGERVAIEVITRDPKTNHDLVYRRAAAPIVLNSEIVGAVGTATDITKQKRAQEQIAYQANLLENVNDAILAYDADLRVTAWNRRAEEQYGWTAKEAIGAYIVDVVGSQLAEDQRAAAMRSLNETGRWQGEITHTRRDGTPIIVETTTMALRDEAGRILTYVTANRDITRRKEAEAQNARLLEEVRASREQLRALSHRLVTMQERERSYVADELYNQAGQVLAALQMQLSRLGREGGRESPVDQLPKIQATLSQAIRELHDLASQLRPVGLDRSTLAGVLGPYVAEFGRTQGLAVQFRPGETATLRLPADIATAVYRAIQEGLANIARHARASEVTLSLSRTADNLTVTLTDNGVGFEPAYFSPTGGVGLASMRERLETFGGKLQIESGKAGTALVMHVPLSQEEQGT